MTIYNHKRKKKKKKKKEKKENPLYMSSAWQGEAGRAQEASRPYL